MGGRGYEAIKHGGIHPIITMGKQRPQRGGNIAKKVMRGVIII